MSARTIGQLVAAAADATLAQRLGTRPLPVNDVYATVQGEGVHTGVPMILLRLHGCAVACSWCDTKETWYRSEATRVATIAETREAPAAWCLAIVADIVAAIDRERAAQAPGAGWVLVTGGEPADQPLAALVAALHAAGYRVALETSGTVLGHIGAGFDHVTVSPKVGNPGGRPVLVEACAAAHEIKGVIGKPDDVERLRVFIEDLREQAPTTVRPDLVVSVQPLSQSARATEVCVAAALTYGWRLSLQTHKAAGLR